MATISILDPVSRIEGHLKVEVTIDYVNGVQQVVDAKATGTMFRGFEAILTNRDPLDGPDITQRICGVCPVSHATAASMALEKTVNMLVPQNALWMRNLVLGSNFIQSHILHFYHLALIDFVDGPAMPPWQPTSGPDKRLNTATGAALINNYVKALEMRRKAHEMGALFGGRLPHPPAFVPGGFTTTPRADRISKFKSYLAEITGFIQNTYLADVNRVASVYSDYYRIGQGYGNLIAYGVFDLDPAGNTKLLKRGRKAAGSTAIQTVDTNAITEQVTYSWYADSTNNLKPASGATTPVYPKTNAYSWLKAPRYGTTPYEAGPLARMTVNGSYNRGVSVMDRHLSRAQEALKIAQAMTSWVNYLSPSGPVYQRFSAPASGSGAGLTEAARGALGHWLQISNGRIARYQVITPTCWNASPRDAARQMGPMEKALIGTPVKDASQPVEVVRVVHSFDPCLSCAVHVMRPEEDVRVFALGRHPGA